MIRQRDEWYRHQRAYPLKHIPAGLRLKALRKRQAMEAQALAIQPSATSPWTLVGPEPIDAAPGIPFGGSPTLSGRVTAMVVDPTNASIVYAGGADGGVWKTTNGGTDWTPLTDTQASLAVGAIAIDPSNHNIIYVGTGEDNNNLDGYSGAGVLKSTDGGTTWTHIPGQFVGPFGATTGGGSIGSLAVHPSNGQIVLAAVSLPGADGIYRSTDGGTTWTATGLSGSGLSGTGVVFDPTNGNNAFAAIGNAFGNTSNGIYKSTDGGVTWTLLVQSNPPTAAGRITIAIAPSSPTTLYAAIATALNGAAGAGSLYGLFKTTDGGTTFNATAAPDFCGSDGTANQCWYDMALAVAPNNANVVYAAGKYTYSTNAQTTVIRSTDGGATWSLLGAGANGVTVHTDVHTVAFSADSGTVYVGCDGGVWSTTDVTASAANWTSQNATLALTQFYNGISIDPTNVNRGFGGAQDNGPLAYTGSLAWAQPTSGDGGFTAIDPVAVNTDYVTTTNNTIYKSTTGGLSGYSDVTPNIGTDRAAFIAPFVIDPTSPSNLYFGANRLYQTADGATTWNVISPDLTTGTGTLSAIAVAPNNSNTVYTGSNDAVVSVTTNALLGTGSTWTTISSTATRAVTDIKVDATTSTTAYVTYGGFSGFTDTVGHVFKTTNGGTSWTDISGNLPNIPVTSIAIDPDVANTLYVGTDIGAFYTSNGGTTWSTLGTGLPNSGVMALAFHHATRTLRAGTHGRSAWDLSLANTFALTVTEAGTGTGTVTSSPAGINCPGTCSANFNSGTMVTLTQAAGASSTFAGWSGACTGTGTCTVTMSAAESVTATFNTVTFALTVTVNGSGTVTSSPADISCPTTCSASFASGTMVTLNETPGMGATFTGWSGACTGTGACSVTMSAAEAVTATFASGTTPTTTTLSLSPTTVTTGSSGPVVMTARVAPTTGTGTPTGSVNFFENGTSVGSGTLSSGTATFNYNPNALVAGTYSITAQYGGDTTFTGSSSSPQSLTVQTIAPTTTTLTLSPTSVNVGSSGPLVITAKVAPTTGTGTPTGSVNFFVNGGTSVGSGTLSSGSATFNYTPSGLAAGTDNVTATYLGDSHFATSTSSPQTLSVQDFTITANSTTITVTDGQSGTSTLTITPLGGFSQTLSYSCSGLPSESNCTLASAGANSETITISTTAPSYARSWNSPFGRGGNLVYALLLPGLLGLVLPASRRKRAFRRLFPLIGVLAVLTLWLPACSSPTTTHNAGTPKGSYPITVTASTSGSSGTLSHTSTITLTVQ
jgi:photosystem II stability/assembly factor-like uncharacterized protein